MREIVLTFLKKRGNIVRLIVTIELLVLELLLQLLLIFSRYFACILNLRLVKEMLIIPGEYLGHIQGLRSRVLAINLRVQVQIVKSVIMSVPRSVLHELRSFSLQVKDHMTTSASTTKHAIVLITDLS